ncbi:MAG: hypothetical protein DI586_03550 [Micavibrio aeruginosavorus]|uniref:Uncharacterized protein n=1 Tax=Micavibrio aeruginosavorus TaxID=349221 RepID=A0A2W5FNC1_9BACT|nr:MAG: hypothetical protein DI586_03550 [Micavibrio aeruginosavorus]
MTDTITILKCNYHKCRATKTFIQKEDGVIEKVKFSAGKEFTHEERDISSISDIEMLLRELQHEPQKLVIRGKPKEGIKEVGVRVCNGPLARFVSVPRKWVMLDVDDFDFAAGLNINNDTAQIIAQMKSLLPEIFRKSKGVYKLSSSQNVGGHRDDPITNSLRCHFWFMTDVPIRDDQWKSLLKGQRAKIDLSLFNPVQAHYTANPIFIGMDDPISERIGQC